MIVSNTYLSWALWAIAARADNYKRTVNFKEPRLKRSSGNGLKPWSRVRIYGFSDTVVPIDSSMCPNSW